MHRAKSAAERQRERRARLWTEPMLWEEYLKKDREPKKQWKEVAISGEMKKLRLRTKLATRRWRVRTQNQDPDTQEVDIHEAYASPSGLTRATRRAQDALPKSPRKAKAVVVRLVDNMLHVDLTTGKPARTAANALTQETLALVDDFYHNDDVSNIMPGKADTISIMKDGVRTTLQKRHMTMTIGEAYALFQEDHPDLLRKSKFAELRPRDVLLVSKYPQNVCGCRYHTNMCLLLSALNKKLPQIFPVYSRAEFLAQCACNLESQECMIGDCEACCDGKLLAENFTNKIPPAILKDQIKYHKWTSGARVEKEQITSSVEEACKTLAGDLTAFRWHSFVKTHQENSYKLDKSVAQAPDSKVLCLQMDFSENFSIQQQNEIQSAHWHHDQLTVYTIMMWHRQSKLPWVIISDNLSHDKFAVTAFLKVILDEIKSSESFKEVQEVRVWTDGPSSQ